MDAKYKKIMQNKKMLQVLIQKFQNDPKSFFFSSLWVLGGLFAIFSWLLRPKSPESGFKVREYELKKKKPRYSSPELDQLANAKMQQKSPLLLEGLRLDGTPHEILGVAANASQEQIQQAYRNLMKRYHPDRVGRPGSREWNDAQKIAEKINQAKDQLLKKK